MFSSSFDGDFDDFEDVLEFPSLLLVEDVSDLTEDSLKLSLEVGTFFFDFVTGVHSLMYLVGSADSRFVTLERL